MKNFKKGISLITLVITIIVVIILAGVVILSLQKNNPLNQASKARFLNDIETFKEDLELYKQNQYLKNNGQFNEETLNAPIDGLNIYDVIPSLKDSSYSKNDFKVEKGKLVYQGTNKDYQDWSKDAGIKVDKGQVIVKISAMQIKPVKAGVDIKYSIELNSASNITDNNLSKNIVIIDKDGKDLSTQPTITLSEYNGTDTSKTTVATINTTGISDGEYRLKVKAGAVNNNVNVSNDETISSENFEIDSTAPSEAITYTISPEGYTNGNVTLTLNKPSDVDKIMYSIDGTNYTEYSASLTIISNENIYVKLVDVAENESTPQTITITSIDKTNPNISINASVSVSGKIINGKITLSDNVQIDYTKSKYIISDKSATYSTSDSIWDNATTITESPINISQTEVAGDYYIQVLAGDEAGNKIVLVSNKLTIVESEYPKSNGAGDEGSNTLPAASTENTTIDGKNPTYNDPVIPAGFIALNTNDGTTVNWTDVSSTNIDEKSSWNQGLAIQDSAGNQFVWVPVDGINVKYQKDFSYPSWYEATSLNTSDDSFPEKLNETSLVNKYGGFYIARYEASFDYNNGNIRTKSIKSINKTTDNWSSNRTSAYSGYVWNWVDYIDAKSYSENMGVGFNYDTTKVGTNLVTGTQWDTTMKWIQNAGYDVINNSSSWGNSLNSTSPANISGYGNLQVTGYSNYWKSKNIYDLAGNEFEWTNEKNSTYFIHRGCGYDYDSSNPPAACRINRPATGTYINVGFRFAMYIK